MSQKTAKAQRKEQKAKEADYKLRHDAMIKEIEKLSNKYKIDLVAVINYHPNGIIPKIGFIDMKDRYEQMTEEAKKAEAAKKSNGELKPSPKLEV